MRKIAEKSEKHPERMGERGYTKLVFLLLIVSGLAISLFLLPFKQYVVAVLEWTKDLGVWGPIFLAGFYVLAAVLFLPGSVLTLGAGFLFGVPAGLATVWIGANLGACAAFLVGRTIAREWVAQKVKGNAKFAAIDEALGREGFKVVLLLRLSPVFPFDLLNYALGITKVSFRNYALASLIGMVPGTLMYVYFGSAARSLAEVAAGKVEGGIAGQAFFWFGLAATIAVALVVTRIARKSLKTAEVSASADPKPSQALPQTLLDEEVEVSPDDEHNRELVSNVHPPNWVNPQPAERYNLVVIGAGTAGLVTAAGAAGLGAKVALVERHLMGGDCLNYGCVPSKALIRSSRAYAEIRDSQNYGIDVDGKVTIAFSSVMERLRKLRAKISHHDSAKRLKDLGVDVFMGNARFTGPNTVEVDGKSLHFKKAVIATGARAVHPGIRGLAVAGFLTNETVFSLTARPSRLAVIGGGPIGCEMAQAFQRLGSQVMLFHKNDHILDREDRDAAEIIQNRFIGEGVRLILNSDLKEVELVNGEKIIHFEIGGKRESVAVDEILVGAGRAPNVENLNLEAAGVQYDTRRGVFVDDHLQTANPAIFAAGDVSMNYKFTHTADAAARIVIQNALFKGSKKLSALTVPWCTYTDPEIAHVGMYERDASKHGIAVDTFVKSLAEVDRAMLDGEDEGFVKIHVKKGTDQILGATIVAAHAGEMISELTLAMVGKLGLGTISGVIHPYPTQAEAIKQAADAYNRTRLTPLVKTLFTKWLSWTR
ncbi:MAG: FAD-containing oxidoreductase [Desulfomonile tiedjei]|uniref:FAD-containing oxidoreductase n=1 Tax=Desulfomonile tiedjei TaxID=2358 RepID=A0A9D6Z409_9BACT|nr:FAD-containing oxidoreductase [Desulfomonile tiedjei]